jgi:hypothetical protein
MKQTYNIGNIQFKTKKATEEFTRNKIKVLGCIQISKDHQDYIFFVNLLKNHPEFSEKKGVGIDYFFIQPNSLNNTYFQTMIKRTDGSIIDFSWVNCCKFKPCSPTDNLKKAFREAIKEETIHFKQNNSLVCSFCLKDNEEYSKYHVDHNEPSFKTLYQDYLQKTKHKVPVKFGDCNFLTSFLVDDKIFKDDWIAYHNSNCNLQILCSSCNLKKK